MLQVKLAQTTHFTEKSGSQSNKGNCLYEFRHSAAETARNINTSFEEKTACGRTRYRFESKPCELRQPLMMAN